MKNLLATFTNQELWRFFPIILSSHQIIWEKAYHEEESCLIQIIGSENIARINHYGSTAVPGLIAKPTIDILLEITETCDTDKLMETLIEYGYLYAHQPDDPSPHMMFMKGYSSQGFEGQAFHLHVRYIGDWDELYFRDYLIAHTPVAREYGELKLSLLETYQYDRDGYTNAKTEFIKRYTDEARQEFLNRYKPLEK